MAESSCLNCGKELIKHKQKKFCSRLCVQNYYKKDKERNVKISKNLKKYFAGLTSKERSKLYNTCHKGALHANTKSIGSSYIMKHGGYVMEKTNDGWISQHRLVVERFLNRKLRKGETIHHINENRLNNKLKNLYLFEKRGLHTSFTLLVKYGIVELNVLKSNLRDIKVKEKGEK